MQTASMLEAEWRQVLLESLSTGAKEDESSTGDVSAAGFHHVKACSCSARILKFMNHLFLQIMDQWIWGHACISLQYLKWLSKHCKSSLLNKILYFY
jgi:hypothetical protein